jgi:hypothetical protein
VRRILTNTLPNPLNTIVPVLAHTGFPEEGAIAGETELGEDVLLHESLEVRFEERPGLFRFDAIAAGGGRELNEATVHGRRRKKIGKDYSPFRQE